MPITAATTRYFKYRGEPCRVHRAVNGDQTADVYRSGETLIEVDPTDVLWGEAIALSPEMYEELVNQKDALSRSLIRVQRSAGLPPARQSGDCLPRFYPRGSPG